MFKRLLLILAMLMTCPVFADDGTQVETCDTVSGNCGFIPSGLIQADCSGNPLTFGQEYNDGTFTLQAQFEPKKYNIIYHVGTCEGKTAEVNPDGYVTDSEALTYDSPWSLKDLREVGFYAPTGTTFQGWNADSDASADYQPGAQNGNWNQDNDLHVYAVCEANSYLIKYMPGTAGSATVNGAMADQPVNYGDTDVVLSQNAFYTTPDAYTFDGWECKTDTNPQNVVQINEIRTNSETQSANYQITSYNYTSNVICTAQWTPVSCNDGNIKYELDDGVLAAGVSNPTGWTYDNVFHVNAPSKNGYDFAGWKITGLESGVTHYYGSSNPPATSSNAATLSVGSSVSWFKNLRASCGVVTFTAQWKAKGFKITYYIDGQLDNTDRGNPFNYTVGMSPVTLVKPNISGYEFDGWYLCNSADNYPDTTQPVEVIPGDFVGNLRLCGTTTRKVYDIVYHGCINGDCSWILNDDVCSVAALRTTPCVTGLDVPGTYPSGTHDKMTYSTGDIVVYPRAGEMTVPNYAFDGRWYARPNFTMPQYQTLASYSGRIDLYTRLTDLCCKDDTYLNHDTGACEYCPIHSHVDVDDASGCGLRCICDDGYEFGEDGGCKPKEFVIELNMNGGDAQGTPELYTKYNTGVYIDQSRTNLMTTNSNGIVNPSRTGYTFLGYYDDPTSSTNKYIETTSFLNNAGNTAGRSYTTDKVWYAQWRKNNYKLYYSGGVASGTSVTSVAMPVQVVAYNATHSLAQNTFVATTNDLFTGWVCEGNDSNATVSVNYDSVNNVYRIVMPAEDVTCTAQWNPCSECSNETDCDCEVSVVNNQCVYDTSAPEGYELVSGEGTSNPICNPIPYSVYYYCDNNQNTQPVSTDYPHYYNETVTVQSGSLCSSNDSVFVGWNCIGRKTPFNPGDTFLMPNSDAYCYAVWRPCDVCNAGEGCTCELSVVGNQCTYTTGTVSEWWQLVSGDGTPAPLCNPKYLTTYYPGNCGGETYQDMDNLTVQGGSYTVLGLGDTSVTDGNGRHFVRWSMVPSGTVGYVAGDSITNTQQNISLYAVCESDTFNIIYTGGTASNDSRPLTWVGHQPSESMANQPVLFEEQNVALHENQFSVPGYYYVDWVGDYNAVTGEEENTHYADEELIAQYNIDDDLTLEAQWLPNPYDIIFHKGQAGNRPVSEIDGTMNNQTVHYDDLHVVLNQNQYSITGYNFLGWKQNNVGSIITDGSDIGPYETLGDTNLYAQWTPKTYDIVYNHGSCNGANNGDGTFTDAGALRYDAIYTLLGLTGTGFSEPTGYEFLGWSTVSNSTNADDLLQPGVQFDTWTQDNGLTLYAVCAKKEFKIKYSGGIAGGLPVTVVAMNPQTVTYHGSVVLNDNTYVAPGYTFVNWLCSATPESGDVPGEMTLPDGAVISSYRWISDMECEAQWEQDTYSVTYDCNALENPDSVVPIDGDTYTYGADVTTQDNTCVNVGHDFDGWECGLTRVIAGETFVITGDTTCEAIWSPKKYNVSYKVGSCAGNEYVHNLGLTYGETYDVLGLDYPQMTVVEPTGYEFLGWSLSPTSNTVDVQPGEYGPWMSDEGWELYAVCQIKDYHINYDHQGGQFEDDSQPMTTYTINTQDDLIPLSVRDDYYVFEGWFDGQNGTGTEYTYVPGDYLRANPQDITLYADWEKAGKIDYNCRSMHSLNTTIHYKKPVGTTVVSPEDEDCGTEQCVIDHWACDDGNNYAVGENMTIPDASTLTCDAVRDCSGVDYPIVYHVYTVDGEDIEEIDSVEINGTETSVSDITPETYRTSESVAYPIISKMGYSFEGWFDSYEDGVFTDSVTGTPLFASNEEPSENPLHVHGKLVKNQMCKVRYYNVDGATYPNGTNPNSYVLGGNATNTPVVTLYDPHRGYYRFKGWHLGSPDGELVTEINYDIGSGCGIDLYAEWEFECNAPNSDHWLHIGDNPNDKVCLYEDRQTTQTPAVRVKGNAQDAYYMMLSPDPDKVMHEGSTKKMRIKHNNGVYNVCDRSSCPEMM